MKAFVLLVGLMLVSAADAPGPYFNDFEKAEVGKVPDDFMVLDGPFAVREVEGNKCLELAGDPIGSFGALFGPAGLSATEVSARVWGTPSGKRFPEFGIGVNDAGGYKLFVIPGQEKLELRKGDDAVGSAPFKWVGGSWTFLKLRISGSGNAWVIEGKAWGQGGAEPGEWMVVSKEGKAPSPGRASIWANDYAETPVRFDDLKVRTP